MDWIDDYIHCFMVVNLLYTLILRRGLVIFFGKIVLYLLIYCGCLNWFLTLNIHSDVRSHKIV